jgi:pimeloyl-ACP methyl ester carboxylesterase
MCQATKSSSPVFLLVHGAWHGSWCWRRVTDRLRALGFTAFAPTLTGLADRSHLLSSSVCLTTHINDVVNLVRWEDLHDIVLCGHSYGGMVITGALEKIQDRVTSLVYLDALVPDAGQTVRDGWAVADRPILDSLGRSSGFASYEPMTAEMFRVAEKDRAWVDGKCTAQPYATFNEPLASTSARDSFTNKVFVRATRFEFPLLNGYLHKLKQDPAWKVVELPYGHDLMIDAPDEVTRILIEATDGSLPKGPDV